MAKQPPRQKQAAQAIANTFGQPAAQQVQVTQQVMHQGPIPHPDILKGYDQVVDGLANRIVLQAESETAHRHNQEQRVLQANIAAQERQLSINEYQTKAVFHSDLVGQVLGAIVSLACVGGAVYLAVSDHEGAAAVIAAVPTAAIIKAFFVQRKQT